MLQPQPTLLHRWFDEVWNQGRMETIDELFAPDAIAHGLSDGDGKPMYGPAAFRFFYLSRRQAFPDVHIVIEDCIVEGDKIVVRCLVKGTHTGEGMGVPPTGQKVELGGVCIAQVHGGQIVESWNYYDFVPAYVQLGIVEFKALPHPVGLSGN